MLYPAAFAARDALAADGFPPPARAREPGAAWAVTAAPAVADSVRPGRWAPERARVTGDTGSAGDPASGACGSAGCGSAGWAPPPAAGDRKSVV